MNMLIGCLWPGKRLTSGLTVVSGGICAAARDVRPLARAHPALLVRGLAGAREVLVAAGAVVEDDDSDLPVRRCYVRDPFGNRIELVDARDAGFSEG